MNTNKEELYQAVLPQIEAVVSGESDVIANMANTAAILHETFGFWWTGFYLVKAGSKADSAQELVLGPFQGPVACTRISKGKGVCGAAWEQKATMIVPDVHQFKGHIACSSLSNSEIVVPLLHSDEVWAVLDIDSKEFNTFDETDKHYLEQIANMILFRSSNSPRP